MNPVEVRRGSSKTAPFGVGRYLDEYIEVLCRLDRSAVEEMAYLIVDAWRSNKTVFSCGNGGSASSASHFAMDLTKLSAPPNGHRLRTLALTENIAAISAISNDVAYEEIFVEQMKPFLTPDDVVVGFSTSGSSPNVIRAVEFAKTAGAVTLGVTGRAGGRLQDLAHCTLTVDSTSVQQVEDATMVVAHLLCLRVKEMVALECELELEQLPPPAFGLRASATG